VGRNYEVIERDQKKHLSRRKKREKKSKTLKRKRKSLNGTKVRGVTTYLGSVILSSRKKVNKQELVDERKKGRSVIGP